MPRRNTVIEPRLHDLLGHFQPTTKGTPTEPQSNNTTHGSLNFQNLATDDTLSESAVIGMGNQWSMSIWWNERSAMGIVRHLLDIFTSALGDANSINIDVPGAGAFPATHHMAVTLVGADGTSTNTFQYDIASQTIIGSTTADWQHWVITFDGTETDPDEQLKVYSSGMLRTASDRPATDRVQQDDSAARSIQISNGPSLLPAVGFFHSLALWNKVLTNDEAIALFNHGFGRDMELRRDYSFYRRSDNLIHWWRVNDVTDMGKDSTLVGTPMDLMEGGSGGITNADLLSAAPFGVSTDFLAGGAQHLRNAQENTIGVADSFTVAAWIRMNTIAASEGTFIDIEENNATETNAIRLGHEAGAGGAAPLFRVVGSDGATTKEISGSEDLVVSAWYHVVGVKDGTASMKLYINGEEVASDTSGIPSTTDPGNRFTAIHADAFDGTSSNSRTWISAVALWDEPLTAAEIQGIFNGGFPNIDLRRRAGDYNSGGNLVHWWRLHYPTPSNFGTGGDLVCDFVRGGGINLETDASGVDINSRRMRSNATEGEGTVIITDGATEEFETSSGALGFGNTWTFGFWICLNTLPPIDNVSIWRVGTSGGGRPNLIAFTIKGATANDPLRIVTHNTTGGSLKDYEWDSILDTLTWMHFVLTWDGTDLILYKNGLEVAPDTVTVDGSSAMTDSNRPLHASDIFADFGVDGAFGHTALWDEALTANEVLRIFTGAHSIDLRQNIDNYTSSANLVHYYKLGEDPDTMGRDYAGSLDFIVFTNITHEDNVKIFGPT